MKDIIAFKAIKNIMCTIALIVPLQVGLGITLPINSNMASSSESVSNKSQVVLLDLNNNYCDTECLLLQKNDTLAFFSKTFGVKDKDVIKDLININKDGNFDPNNIGRITNKKGELQVYDSFEKGLIEYLYTFVKKNPKLVNNTVNPYNGKAKYIEDLIKYYTSIYTNVDYLTAVSIGAAESGYYRVKFMLNYNNVYGGMSSKGLIKYKNIEYGVLSFIRLLSYNYYGKGLNTLESIGRIYCPEIVNGVKRATPHWINLVQSAKKRYANSYEEITVSYLLNNKEMI